MGSKFLASVVVLTLTVACTTSTPTGEPGVTQEGRWRVWYKGPLAAVEVGYVWAEKHLGDEWLVLKVGIAGAGTPIPVMRDGIRLFTPQGHQVEPLDQSAFRSVEGSLRMGLDRINAWQGPSSRFMSTRRPCGRWFITPPFPDQAGWLGERASFETVYPSRQVVCGGPLVFDPPVGVQPGRWVLVIELEEGEARIPLKIEGPRTE